MPHASRRMEGNRFAKGGCSRSQVLKSVEAFCLLYLLYPVAQVGLQLQPAQHEAANHAQQDAAHHIDEGDAQPEGAEKHGHDHLVDQRRGDEEGKGNPQRNASLDKPDEERYRRAGAEGGDGPEKRGEQILQPVEAARGEVVAQPFDGEVGIDDTHNRTDEEKQDNNLYRIVEKEVEGAAERGGGIQPEQVVYQPVGKLLYHNRLSFLFVIIRTLYLKIYSSQVHRGSSFPRISVR